MSEDNNNIISINNVSKFFGTVIALKDINFGVKKGETKSYGQIAKKLKISPRYVGKVCGQNKHILVIPCHRVIGSDGSLTGFSADGGINLKKRLIQFEKR